MGRTLTISDELFERLDATARARGLAGVEQLLEHWEALDSELRQRESLVASIDALRDRLLMKYGEMPDSVGLVQEDRNR